MAPNLTEPFISNGWVAVSRPLFFVGATLQQDEEGGEDDSHGKDLAPAGGVQTDALIMAQQESEQQPIAKAGFLFKQGGSVKTVKRRWFVLRGNLLSYYQTEKDKDGEHPCAVGARPLGFAR